MQLSQHAQTRCAQRSYAIDTLDLVHGYGQMQRAPGGVSRILFDAKSLDLAVSDFPERRAELQRYRGVYLILSDEGRVITAARQTRRFHA